MATATMVEPAELRFVIYNVGWAGYEALLEIFGDDGPRICYSKGNVELMSPLFPHERYKKLFCLVVEFLTDELDIPRNAVGSTTFRAQSADRGLEADECYYIANAGRIIDQERFDPEIDPPPDLAIEIEMTNSLLEKLDIYSGLKIPEVWRFDGENLSILHLQADGTYVESQTSASFPFLPMGDVVRLIREFDPRHETRWGRAFRAWVREVVAPLRDAWLRGEA